MKKVRQKSKKRREKKTKQKKIENKTTNLGDVFQYFGDKYTQKYLLQRVVTYDTDIHVCCRFLQQIYVCRRYLQHSICVS